MIHSTNRAPAEGNNSKRWESVFKAGKEGIFKMSLNRWIACYKCVDRLSGSSRSSIPRASTGGNCEALILRRLKPS